MNTQERQRRHYANAEVVGRVINRTSGFAGTAPVTRLDLDVNGNRVQASFFRERSQDISSIQLGSMIHVLGRLSQWGNNGKRVEVQVSAQNHTWAIVEGSAPSAGWSLRGILEGVLSLQDPNDPGAVMALVTVVTPAGERNGRYWDERRKTFEVTAHGEIANRLLGLPKGTTLHLQGTIISVASSDGYGRRTWRSELVIERLTAEGLADEQTISASEPAASVQELSLPPVSPEHEPAEAAPKQARRQRSPLPF